jgi:uncharacterized glyoxalase superfamily protein PhnB
LNARRSDRKGGSVGFTEVVPYLYYEDADAALDWLERVFGFGPSTRWRLGGAITQEADILVGDSRISITCRVPGDNEGAGSMQIVHLEAPDDLDDLFRRVAASEPSLRAEPPEQQGYGPRTFTVTDPWGYRWSFWHGEADPPADE